MTGVNAAIAAVSIGSALLSSSAQKGAINDATAAQERSSQLGIEESRRQFDKLQEVLAPFTEAGTGSIGAQGDLVGLGGPAAEAAAIADIQSGPEFGALVTAGEEGILQNASATGGLRGGNVQDALSRFRPEILSQLISQRFNRLSGISQLGQASAAGVGAGAIRTGENIASSFRNVGEARAEGALGRGTVGANLSSGISDTAGTLLGNDKFMKFIRGIF